MRKFRLIARYYDQSQIERCGTSLREYRGEIMARTAKQAKEEFKAIATAATGFPAVLVLID